MATTLEQADIRARERSARPGRRLRLRPGMLAAAGLLGAVGASACCILPLGLVMLGVTGAWLGRLTALAPYQPIFVVITVAALAGGHVLVNRRAPGCDPGPPAPGRWGEGSSRARCGRRLRWWRWRWRFRTWFAGCRTGRGGEPMTKVIAIVVTMMLLAGAAHVRAAEKRVVLAVDNMTCASCPIIVKRTLARVPGVRSVEVSYEGKTAAVTYDDGRVSVAALLEASATAGYPARIAK